jgi:CubicO group peptidase (beta-lactamase class C family)
LPELGATAWNGATLQQVLDMTTGVWFDESYGGRDAHVFMLDVAANWKPAYPFMDLETLPGCTWDLILSLGEADAEHGARFAYRSIETDTLGYAMERASGRRLSDLVSDRLWAPMGAERDGFFTVDRAGFPLADGGFNGTLRDFARFARLLLEDGQRDGVQVIPKGWIDDIRGGKHGLAHDIPDGVFPNESYRNQFWIPDRARAAHMCRGIFGQHILVDPDRALVAVKLSSWPTFLSDDYLAQWSDALDAVVAAHRG